MGAQSVAAWGHVSCMPLCGSHSAGSLNLSFAIMVQSYEKKVKNENENENENVN
jgi:hypothetical protein